MTYRREITFANAEQNYAKVGSAVVDANTAKQLGELTAAKYAQHQASQHQVNRLYAFTKTREVPGTFRQPEQQQQARSHVYQQLQEHLSNDPAENPPDTAFDTETGEVLARAIDGEVIADPEPNEPSSGPITGEADPVEIIKQITIANLGCNPAIVKTTHSRVPLAAVFGHATVLVEGFFDPPDNKKPCISLGGRFHGINLQSGEQYASPSLGLPSTFQQLIVTMLEAQMASKARGQAAFKGVEFSFRIDAVPAANPSGYSYILKSLMPPQRSDPLAHLKARTFEMLNDGNTHKLLPAPLPPLR